MRSVPLQDQFPETADRVQRLASTMLNLWIVPTATAPYGQIKSQPRCGDRAGFGIPLLADDGRCVVHVTIITRVSALLSASTRCVHTDAALALVRDATSIAFHNVTCSAR
ncbi:hypothetical protein FJTKL_14021 [Diaporthe vaccinii]|uniref:Uncharacterized protein n=1 Tax=Diaporthe vaccinii TaxID=105482 RepID=A0ABR4E9G3_9PEZI